MRLRLLLTAGVQVCLDCSEASPCCVFSSGLCCINMGSLDITQVCQESVMGFPLVFVYLG